MLKPLLTPRELAEQYNRFMPDEVRQYLKGRGIPSTLIDRKLLGWHKDRITLPVFGSDGEVLGFRYAAIPADPLRRPEVFSEPGSLPQLYGWETLARVPQRIVICEGEFDRLLLEGRGIPAVNPTAPGTFLTEWVPYFEAISYVYICFSRSGASDKAASAIQMMLPKARIARLPAEVGEGGTIADFFLMLQKRQLDFELVLAASTPAVADPADIPPTIRPIQPFGRKLRRRAEQVRKAVPLHEIVSQFTNLQAAGGRLVGHCPFHDETSPSMSVYPETNVYRCSSCEAEGEVIQFLMNKESITLGEALAALERFAFTSELYGTS